MFAVERNLTIGMSAYGNAATTKETLECLQRSIDGDYEAILVDDCSPDGGAVLRLFNEFKTHHRRTRIFHFDKNLEYSGSLNAILSHASGDEILFISNDIYVCPAYIRELLFVARSSQRLGIVRGCSNFVDNNKASHNVAPPLLRSFEDFVEFSSQIESRFHGQILLDDYLVGDAFLVKRPVIERIGTLDPQFYGYFADNDFGVRVRAAGFDLVLARGAYAGHKRHSNFEYLPPSERQAKLERRWGRIMESWTRFKSKYGMPADLPYTDINAIPWSSLSSGIADKVVRIEPGDYSRFEIGA
jgi:GT2 family glycosyltransferase